MKKIYFMIVVVILLLEGGAAAQVLQRFTLGIIPPVQKKDIGIVNNTDLYCTTVIQGNLVRNPDGSPMLSEPCGELFDIRADFSPTEQSGVVETAVMGRCYADPGLQNYVGAYAKVIRDYWGQFGESTELHKTILPQDIFNPAGYPIADHNATASCVGQSSSRRVRFQRMGWGYQLFSFLHGGTNLIEIRRPREVGGGRIFLLPNPLPPKLQPFVFAENGYQRLAVFAGDQEIVTQSYYSEALRFAQYAAIGSNYSQAQQGVWEIHYWDFQALSDHDIETALTLLQGGNRQMAEAVLGRAHRGPEKLQYTLQESDQLVNIIMIADQGFGDQLLHAVKLPPNY